MASRRFFRLKVTLAFLGLLLILFFARGVWLTALGWALIHDEGPSKADIAVVLAGDPWGYRLIRATELVKQGYVPRILVSGPQGIYGTDESKVAIRWAVQRGCPAEWFVAVPHQALSTREEAAALLSDMRRRNIHSFLLVTSNYHTARSRRIFRQAELEMGGGPAFRTVASRDEYYAPGNWWRSREGRKTALLEWTKTVAGVFGI